MKVRLLVPLVFVGVVVVGIVAVFASSVLTQQSGGNSGISFGTTVPEPPSAPDFFGKRGIHPPCMGQTSKLPVQTYTGNKPRLESFA